MNELPSPQAFNRKSPFGQIVLLLQGGGALGAYQAGVFEALDQAGVLPTWLCGVSIGAMNAALVAGNPPGKRVRSLRQFWEAVTEPAVPFAPWFFDAISNGAPSRLWANRVSAFTALIYGVPNFFVPRIVPPLAAPAEGPEEASYYDASPLRATLERLVDFDLINQKQMRLSVGATDVQTGASIYFDNYETAISAEHIIASGALPPSFPPVAIDGSYYWDGGVVSNSPAQYIADKGLRQSALVFQVDLWDPNGELPLDITSATARCLEIHSATRINWSLEQFRRRARGRLALARLLEAAADELKADPDVKLLAEEAQSQRLSIVRLRYQTKTYETASKIFEFSRHSMEEHWRAGYDDTCAVLREPKIFELPDKREAARVFDIRRGWLP